MTEQGRETVLERGTVLIVEDDLDFRVAACEAISTAGYVAAGVSNGAEALEVLTNQALPTVILLDLMMPVMSGWDVLGWLARHPEVAYVPVVVMTAVRDCDRARLLHDGVVYCLTKPFHLETLLWALQRVRPRK